MSLLSLITCPLLGWPHSRGGPSTKSSWAIQTVLNGGGKIENSKFGGQRDEDREGWVKGRKMNIMKMPY